MGSVWELGTAELASEYPGPLELPVPSLSFRGCFPSQGSAWLPAPHFFFFFFFSLIASCLATCTVLAAK